MRGSLLYKWSVLPFCQMGALYIITGGGHVWFGEWHVEVQTAIEGSIIASIVWSWFYNILWAFCDTPPLMKSRTWVKVSSYSVFAFNCTCGKIAAVRKHCLLLQPISTHARPTHMHRHTMTCDRLPRTKLRWVWTDLYTMFLYVSHVFHKNCDICKNDNYSNRNFWSISSITLTCIIFNHNHFKIVMCTYNMWNNWVIHDEYLLME